MTIVICGILATIFLIYILVIHDWEEYGKPVYAIVLLMIMCIGIGIELGHMIPRTPTRNH